MLRNKIYKLTHKNIKPYGWIIDSAFVKDSGRGNAFGILIKEKAKGWRIAYLIVRAKSIKRLENHPDSLETFEPVAGRTVIALARPRSPEKFKLFHLDKPVVLKKKVWHDVATLSERSDIKIVENMEVKCVYKKLGKEIGFGSCAV
jgi:ureidoglycolate hydrolase